MRLRDFSPEHAPLSHRLASSRAALRPLDVDFVGTLRAVGKDHDMIVAHFGKPSADGIERLLSGQASDRDLPRRQLGSRGA